LFASLVKSLTKFITVAKVS